MNNKFLTEAVQFHKPVLIKEINELVVSFAPLNNQARINKKPIIIDATVGGGGHAAEFILRGAYVLGIDADEKMTLIAGENLRKLVDSKLACPTGNYSDFFKIEHGNFLSIDTITQKNNLTKVDAIIFDLGISSYHYTFDKGFSFQNPGSPLDMRLSETQKVTAGDLLNALPEDKLTLLFTETIPFFKAKILAKNVVIFRKLRPIKSVGDFLEILKVALKRFGNNKRNNISYPTLPFLALRIAVNSELDNLKIAIEKSWNLLKKGGYLMIISFHSGEDRIVKKSFTKMQKVGLGKIHGKLIVPGNSEISANPRSRSAKLRVIKKI